MLLKTLQLTIRNVRGINRVMSNESQLNIQLRRYGRWASRRPSAIVNENELFEVNLDNTNPSVSEAEKKSKTRTRKAKSIETPKIDLEDTNFPLFEKEKKPKPQITKPKSNVKEKKKFQAEKETKLETQDKENNELKKSPTIYTKLRENEKLVSSIMMSLISKRQRKKNDQILLEGVRFIQDAIEAGVEPQTIIFSRWEDVKDLPITGKDVKLYKVPYKSIQMWSTLTTSPGVMAIFQRPEAEKTTRSSLPITVICDNVRDPGNMGSILRAAAGVGCEKVITTKGCVDFWDFKVLRSAAGAHFRVPIYGSREWDEIKSLISSGAHVYVADNNADCSFVEYKEGEMMEEIQNDSEMIEDIDNENEMIEKMQNKEEKNSNRRSRKHIKKYPRDSMIEMHNFPVIPYYAVDYTTNEIILIVGGETEGLSSESYQLIQDRQGIRVNIPLDNSIDSLNAGMALGIVAFEIKRQFLLVQNKLNRLEQ